MNKAEVESLANQARHLQPYPNYLFPPSVYYRFFQLLAQTMQPKLSVELGVCGGGGSLHLAMGWHSGVVVGVDQTRDHPEHMCYIERVCPNFTFWLGDSVTSAPEIAAKFGKVNILFIDTIHTKPRTLEEMAAWKPYLADGALVCLDDLFRPEMVGLWEEFPEPKLRLDWLHDGAEFGGGFGVVWNG